MNGPEEEPGSARGYLITYLDISVDEEAEKDTASQAQCTPASQRLFLMSSVIMTMMRFLLIAFGNHIFALLLLRIFGLKQLLALFLVRVLHVAVFRSAGPVKGS